MIYVYDLVCREATFSLDNHVIISSQSASVFMTILSNF